MISGNHLLQHSSREPAPSKKCDLAEVRPAWQAQDRDRRRRTPEVDMHVRTYLLQGFLAYKKALPPRTIQWAYPLGLMTILGGWTFLMCEAPL